MFAWLTTATWNGCEKLKNKKTKKILKYCILAFCITCVLGGIFLWAYTRWNLSKVTDDVYFSAGRQQEDVWAGAPDADGRGAAQRDEAVANDEQSGNMDDMNDSENATEEKQSEQDGGAEDTQSTANDNAIANADVSDDKDMQAEGLPEILTDQKGEMTLAFGGDICFYDPYANMGAYRERGSDIEKCISPYLLQEMRNADVCMVNNEFSYSDRGAPLEGKMYTFRSKPENVTILHDMGVDIVSVANNHAYDYGPDAFVDTLKTLDDAKVYHVGGGENLEEASKPVFITKNNLTIGYVAATQIERNDAPDTKGATDESPGVLRCYNQRELDHFLEVVKTAKTQCDFLVVYIHWGTENTAEPDWAQPHQADLISRAGADIIVGCHPHCLQGLALVNDVPVIYSLGNYWFNSKTVDTALLKVKVNADGIDSLQMIAARQTGCATNELSGAEKASVIGYLQNLSPDVSFDEEGFVTW